jgi:hypothetical protein
MPSLNMIVIATLVGFVHICGTVAQTFKPEHVFCGTTSRSFSDPQATEFRMLISQANANLADCEILLNNAEVWEEK